MLLYIKLFYYLTEYKWYQDITQYQIANPELNEELNRQITSSLNCNSGKFNTIFLGVCFLKELPEVLKHYCTRSIFHFHFFCLLVFK